MTIRGTAITDLIAEFEARREGIAEIAEALLEERAKTDELEGKVSELVEEANDRDDIGAEVFGVMYRIDESAKEIRRADMDGNYKSEVDAILAETDELEALAISL